MVQGDGRAVKIRSFAKINLGIDVLGKREDGYHEIRTLFQAVEFSDILEFRPSAAREVRLSGTDASIPWDERNLIHRAARLLQQDFPKAGGGEVLVTKNIPPGKGLGGGSSNAAMTLFALNGLWELGLDRSRLQEYGRRLGATVPYFLDGGFCMGEGRSAMITPLPGMHVL